MRQFLPPLLFAILAIVGGMARSAEAEPPKKTAATPAPSAAENLYFKQLKAAIGSRWVWHMKNERKNYETGSTKVAYRITPDGKLDHIRIAGNTSNDAFARMCLACVAEAEIPKPPAEILAMMKDGGLEQDMTFNYVPALTPSRSGTEQPKPRPTIATPGPRRESERSPIPFRKEPETTETARQLYEKRRPQ